MATPEKTTATMKKHLTETEIAARAEAETATMPKRTGMLKKPAMLRDNKAAAHYWKAIIKRMDGLEILDVLDTEMLAVYCIMLSRRDEMPPDDKDLPALERNLLQYAEKLGLTPTGRVRLAQQRAKAALAQADPDGDLYGD